MLRRMRTINGIIDFIKKEDNDTAINRYIIETLILKKKVFYIKSGSKFIIDLDDVLAELNLNKGRN